MILNRKSFSQLLVIHTVFDRYFFLLIYYYYYRTFLLVYYQMFQLHYIVEYD